MDNSRLEPHSFSHRRTQPCLKANAQGLDHHLAALETHISGKGARYPGANILVPRSSAEAEGC
jgi:hypothetical protein